MIWIWLWLEDVVETFLGWGLIDLVLLFVFLLLLLFKDVIKLLGLLLFLLLMFMLSLRFLLLHWLLFSFLVVLRLFVLNITNTDLDWCFALFVAVHGILLRTFATRWWFWRRIMCYCFLGQVLCPQFFKSLWFLRLFLLLLLFFWNHWCNTNSFIKTALDYLLIVSTL